MKFCVTRFSRHGPDDSLLEEANLVGVTADEVRSAFGLDPDEYPGDCIPIRTPEQVAWIKGKLPEIDLDLERYECFVEAYSA